MIEINKCLVVVAHPDDEVLGCGGLIKKLTSEKKEVLVVFINDGYDERFVSYNVKDIKKEKRKQIQNSSNYLGFKFITLDYEATKFDIHGQRRINDEVLNIVKNYQPDTILTHHSGDLHQDHIIVNKAVMIASRSKYNNSIKNILTFPTQSSSELNCDWHFKPNLFIDIDKFIAYKYLAMSGYIFEGIDENRSENAILKWSQFWGMLTPSKNVSEPYEIKRIYA